MNQTMPMETTPIGAIEFGNTVCCACEEGVAAAIWVMVGTWTHSTGWTVFSTG